MSRKSRAKSDRSPDAWSKAVKRGAGTAAAGSQPSIGWTILFAALALVVSAVFFAQLIRPDGFLAAVTQADMARLERNQDAGVAPNWETLFASLREELRRQPTTRRHEAVARLIAKLIDVERGKADATTASTEIESLLAEDADNLLSRVVCAVIGDEAGAATTPEAIESKADVLIARFHAMEKVVAGVRPTRESRLYNKEYDEAWFGILRNGVSRRDVASNLAKYIRHYEIREQYAALPMIQRRLIRLADELDAAGHRDEARSVRRWLVQLFVGLMRSEPDAGTRLLCADLLERTLRKSEPQLAEQMAALRREFHAAAETAPIDLTDPARSPAVMPDRYRTMMNLMVFAVFMVMAGLGAASVLLISALSGMFRILWRMIYCEPVGGDGAPPSIEMRSIPIRIAIAVASIGGLVGLLQVFWPLDNAALFSEVWGYHALVLALAMGAMLVLIRSALATKDGVASDGARSKRKRRALVAIVLAIVPIVLTVIPPPWLEWPMRWLDLGVPSIIVLIVLMLILVAVAYRLIRVSPRITTATAAMTWLICVVVGALFMLNHGLHEIVISRNPDSRSDEIPSRLRTDWESRFLTNIAKAYDIPAS